MKRRSFIQSLLAIPVVAAVAKYAPSVRPKQPESFFAQPRPLDGLEREWLHDHWQVYRRYIAGDGIREGQMLTMNLNSPTVSPASDRKQPFVGLATHDAMKGDVVRVIVEGSGKLRFN